MTPTFGVNKSHETAIDTNSETSLRLVCMNLLKSGYPHVQGLQDCMMSDTLNFESQNGDFVQILNCTRNHWICISTVGCWLGKINMFDNMRTGDVPLSTKEAIVSLLCTTVIPDVQQQPNHYDCGSFALAYASNVCVNL